MKAASSFRLVRLPASRWTLLHPPTLPTPRRRGKAPACYCAASDIITATTAAVLKDQSFLVVGKEWYAALPTRRRQPAPEFCASFRRLCLRNQCSVSLPGIVSSRGAQRLNFLLPWSPVLLVGRSMGARLLGCARASCYKPSRAMLSPVIPTMYLLDRHSETRMTIQRNPCPYLQERKYHLPGEQDQHAGCRPRKGEDSVLLTNVYQPRMLSLCFCHPSHSNLGKANRSRYPSVGWDASAMPGIALCLHLCVIIVRLQVQIARCALIGLTHGPH